jgi:LemA protein
VKQDEVVKKAWNDVQTEYQNRSDLVPNLVNTVKGAANFEQETLTKVVEARAKATSIQLKAEDLNAENMAKFQEAQSELSGALSRLLRLKNIPTSKQYKVFSNCKVNWKALRTTSRIRVKYSMKPSMVIT